jgi:putative ABC transport system ATP-binding protein
MNDIMIKVDKLEKDFTRGSETIKAVNGVSFEVPKGQLVAITGASGAGKTTLLSCIGLLEKPTSGGLEVNGKMIKGISETGMTVLRRQLMGFVFQRFFLIPTLSALDNVMLPLAFAGKSKPRNQVIELMKKLGVGDRIHHKPGQISGGEMQRVAIARALVLDPPVIIADEPTGNLDSSNAGLMFDLFKKLASEGKTILVATHTENLARSCDRIIHMVDGKVVA